MKTILIPLAEGVEELEAVTLMDLFVRAGFEVVRAGLKPGEILAACGTRLIPDVLLSSVAHLHFDAIVLPGGQPGANNLAADETLIELLQRHQAAERPVGALCAAPRVLVAAGVASGRTMTAFPGALDGLETGTSTITDAVHEFDGPVWTSRGPGTAMDFALAIIEKLGGTELRQSVEVKLVRPE